MANTSREIDLNAVLLHLFEVPYSLDGAAVSSRGKAPDQHKLYPMLNQTCQQILEVAHVDPP